MRVLITGGAGFIGSHLTELLQDKAEVIIYDNLRTGFLTNLEGLKYTFVKGDIMDKDRLYQAMSIVDYVIHLAAVTNVAESMDYPEECNRLNIDGTYNVLDAATKAGVKKVVHMSTCAAYGDSLEMPKRESSPAEPLSPYGISKVTGEMAAGMYNSLGRVKTVAVRGFNIYGPRSRADSAYASVISLFINRARNGENLNIFGDGEQIRDFIYVKDIVRALWHFCQSDCCGGVYNLATGIPTTVNKLAVEINALFYNKSKIVHLPPREGDVRDSLADVSKSAAAGFTAEYSISAGLAETINYSK